MFKAVLVLTAILACVLAEKKNDIVPGDLHRQLEPLPVLEFNSEKENNVELMKRSPYYSGGNFEGAQSSDKPDNYGYYGYTDGYGYGFYYTGQQSSRVKGTTTSGGVKNNDFDLVPELGETEILVSNASGLRKTEQGITDAQQVILYVAGGFGCIGCGILAILVFRRFNSGPVGNYDFSTEGNTQYSYQSVDSAALSNASSYAPAGGYGAVPGASVYLPGPAPGAFNMGTAYGGTAYGGYGGSSQATGTSYGYGAYGTGATAYGAAGGSTAYGATSTQGSTGQTAYVTRI
jgi:hypothetical protein